MGTEAATHPTAATSGCPKVARQGVDMEALTTANLGDFPMEGRVEQATAVQEGALAEETPGEVLDSQPRRWVSVQRRTTYSQGPTAR